MPLSYPISLALFQDKFKISMAQFYVNSPRQVDRTAGGSQNSASLGDAVWRGSFSVPPTNQRSVSAQLDALLSVLDRAGSSFLVYDPSKCFPAEDPGGSILGGANVTIGSLSGTDARLMSLSGLPAVLPIARGRSSGFQLWQQPYPICVAPAG